MKKAKCLLALSLAGILASGVMTGCEKERETHKNGREAAELIWYQIGSAQKDSDAVLEKVNEYTQQKIGVKLKIVNVGWGDYNQKMKAVINSGDDWDLCFTSSWTNDYLQNVQKGAFLELDEYLEDEGKEMFGNIDPRFWKAAKVGGKTYGIPNEKKLGTARCGYLPKNMWTNIRYRMSRFIRWRIWSPG